MEMKTGKLGLKIPVQNSTKRSQLNTDPDSIKKWRAALPMADTGATAKKLFFTLNELNQVTIEPEKRFEILELLRPPLQLVCQSLKKHYTNQTTALTKQKLTIANLAQTLQLETANGYKTIIEERFLNRKEATTEMTSLVIYRIMHYYTMILCRCYQLYAKEPSGIWQELHILYKYAKKENILEHKIEGISSIPDQTSTIATSYTHILLLAASNPFQWRQNEQEAINNILDLWVSYTSLRSYTEADQKKPSLYIIDLDKDLPPSPLGLQQIEPSQSCIILSLEKECSHIKKILTELDEDEIKARMTHANNSEYAIAAASLHRLMNSWNSIVTRKHKRFTVSGKMQVIFGLSAAHYHIGGAKPFEPNNDEKKKTSVNNNESLELTDELPSIEDISQCSINLEVNDVDSNSKTKDKPAVEKFIIYNCSLMNISPTGSCLIWENDISPLVQPGEIIAMRTSENINEKANNAPWNIGVIRWLKHTDNDKIRVGIQLLAPYAKAAGAQILKDNTPAGYFLRCLILPKMEDLALNTTIITPILPFKEGRAINLYNAENEPMIKMKLTKQVDATSSYRQFEYSTEQAIDIVKSSTDKQKHANPAINKHHKSNTGDNGEVTDKFNSIWDEL